MEYTNFAQRSLRSDSNISDVDITDTEHCLLCYNNLYIFQLGRCNHKNICHTCGLRLRLIMKDIHCPICKTELEEIVMSDDFTLTFDKFSNELKGELQKDKDDQTIYFLNAKV